jgi:tetratricopeptide (TPR) repeat protein
MISANLAIAKLLMQDRQFEAAGHLIKKTFADNPDHLLAGLYRTRFLMATGEGETALATFAEGAGKFSDSPQFQLEYGEALWQLGQIESAKVRLTIASTTEPARVEVGSTAALKITHAAAHYDLALIHRDEGQWRDAARALDQGLVLSPYHLDALLLSAALAIRANDHAQALLRLTTLVSLPDTETFASEDILKNLPLPGGAILLVEAYLAAEKSSDAIGALDVAISLLQSRGQANQTEALTAKRTELLTSKRAQP